MKRIINMIGAACLLISTQGLAQTNRTYKTDMQNNRIYQMERQGQSIDPQGDVDLRSGERISDQESQGIIMEEMTEFQGYSPREQTESRNAYFGNKTAEEIQRSDLPYISKPYDTTKNNGNCLGCGSGALTDPHDWRSW